MSILPKDYTAQENIIADCLTEFGLRYDQQYDFFPYTVDFYLSELKMVIEADGKHGHLQKRDAKRDINLAEHDEVLNILHVRDATKEKIKETLWLALNKLSDNEAN
tara:strand:- start:64 stop:381 length:318 start_codon:yes stop_codon:yes gene_type:complete